jgi:tetratricopeptide (TPR) repeat protein
MNIRRNDPCPCGSGERYKNCCAAVKGSSPIATTSNKDKACILVDHGNAKLAEDKFEEALSLYQQALSIYPEYARVHYNIGVAFQRTGRIENAISSYQKTLSITPEDVEANINLGVLLKSLDRVEEAVACYKRALKINPDHAEAYNNLGVIYQEQSLLDKAESCSRKALSINPEYAEAYNNLGSTLKKQGLLEEAISCCQKALLINPGHAESHFLMSSLHKYKEGDPLLIEMEQLYSQPGIGEEQRVHLSFGLGKAYEDVGNYEKSFLCLKEGNRIKRSTIKYSIDGAVAEFNQIKRTFSKSFINDNKGAGIPDKTPVFIIGMPRSGTSLVEQILASHPEVYGAGELPFVINIMSQMRKRFQTGATSEVISGYNEEFIAELGREYIEKTRELSPDSLFITDKMPHNFLWVGAIRMSLPNAKIICCRRDPMDNCLSIYKNIFHTGHNYSFDLQELGQYYLLYQDLMNYWHELFPGKIYDIYYEALVSNQKEETTKLLDHCGLTWDDACLSFHKTSRSVNTASAVQVRKPVYKDSMQLWKRYESQLQPLTEILKKGEP